MVALWLVVGFQVAFDLSGTYLAGRFEWMLVDSSLRGARIYNMAASRTQTVPPPRVLKKHVSHVLISARWF